MPSSRPPPCARARGRAPHPGRTEGGDGRTRPPLREPPTHRPPALAPLDAHLEAITARTPALLRAGALFAEIIDVQSAA
ncbi:hypothetical protein [Streptomyces sp. NPDC004134]|uniref:hypothetical protein n=1 Tax=Streptomyces sp. NPDC004134 TaxID=3364691 RepID=UPI0036CAD549